MDSKSVPFYFIKAFSARIALLSGRQSRVTLITIKVKKEYIIPWWEGFRTHTVKKERAKKDGARVSH